MNWQVTITFPAVVGDQGNALLHRVRNFGETLYRQFNASGWGIVDLERVDNASTTLVVERVRKRDLGRAIQVLRQLAAAEFPERTPEITKAKSAE